MHPITTVHYLVLSAALLLIGTAGRADAPQHRDHSDVHRADPERREHQPDRLLARACSNVNGQIFAIFVITDAVAEAAVGLGILIALFRNKETVQADEIDLLKW